MNRFRDDGHVALNMPAQNDLGRAFSVAGGQFRNDRIGGHMPGLFRGSGVIDQHGPQRRPCLRGDAEAPMGPNERFLIEKGVQFHLIHRRNNVAFRCSASYRGNAWFPPFPDSPDGMGAGRRFSQIRGKSEQSVFFLLCHARHQAAPFHAGESQPFLRPSVGEHRTFPALCAASRRLRRSAK